MYHLYVDIEKLMAVLDELAPVQYPKPGLTAKELYQGDPKYTGREMFFVTYSNFEAVERAVVDRLLAEGKIVSKYPNEPAVRDIMFISAKYPEHVDYRTIEQVRA